MSETSSFHSALESPCSSSPSDSFLRFTPEEEAELIASSNKEKISANTLYASSQFSEAVGAYDHALSFLPQHLDYEIAVLKSNIAACHVRLAEWKQAVKAAEAALDGLERVLPSGAQRTKPKSQQPSFQWREMSEGDRTEDEEKKPADPKVERIIEENGVVELDGDEEEAARKLEALKLNDERREQVNNLRAKSWLRRARANFELGGWTNLASAEEDYKALSQMQNLPAKDKAFVRKQLVILGPKIQAAKEKDTAEMMGKLKELGNGILKPFGLSTDMFNFEKDEKTGGYSMSINQ